MRLGVDQGVICRRWARPLDINRWFCRSSTAPRDLDDGVAGLRAL